MTIFPAAKDAATAASAKRSGFCEDDKIKETPTGTSEALQVSQRLDTATGLETSFERCAARSWTKTATSCSATLLVKVYSNEG